MGDLVPYVVMGLIKFLSPLTAAALEYQEFDGTQARSSSIVPPPRTATSGVTTSDALGLVAVHRAVSIISVGLKSLTIKAYQGTNEVEAPVWLTNPDRTITLSTWIEQITNSLALAGNAYLRPYRNPRGEVVKVEVLNPFDVQIQTDDNGNLSGYLYRGVTQFGKSDLSHLALMRVPGNLYGLGPIQAAQKELANAKSTAEYVEKWYDTKGVPSGILKSDQILTTAQVENAKEAWNTTSGASNGVAVLGAGLDWKPATFLTPNDMQYVDIQKWSRGQVAALFGIPAQMLLAPVEGSGMTYTNVEAEQINFVRYTLAQYSIEIEQALSALLPVGVTARLNLDSLLRADTTTRYQAHEIAIRAGFKTIDEVRITEGLPPLGGI